MTEYAHTADLEGELQGLIRDLPEFQEGVYEMFSLDDVEEAMIGRTPPLAFVGYNGCLPVKELMTDGRRRIAVPSTGSSSGAVGVVLMEEQYVVALVVPWNFNGQSEERKQALSLLKRARGKILGYQGINTRPWRFVIERPEPDIRLEGAIVYSQIWVTLVPAAGENHSQ